MKMMIKKFSLYTFIFMTLPCLLWSEIVDISSITQINEHLRNDSLVIFDLDNTIFEPTQELGNDQWFRQRIRDYRNTGLDKEVSVEHALIEWLSIQGVTKMKLVEEQSIPMISMLQDSGRSVMGLTTRGMEVSVQTLHHLKKLGVHLSFTSPFQKEHVFMNGPRGVLFKKGILFTSGTNKGSALFNFLEHADFVPKHIIFINDKASNLKEVEDFCFDKKIPFIGLRYAFLDNKVESYNHSVAIKQFEHFGKILTDDHAKNLLKKKTHSNF